MARDARLDLRAFIGASGSGKGVSIARALRAERPRRLLIWDPKGEYGAFASEAPSLAELAREVGRAGAGAFRLRYVPRGVKLPDAFAVLCRLAIAAEDCTFLAEELSDVTSPSWAPPEWKRITTQGRHHGLTVLAAAQRPALVDKSLMGNANLVRCFALRYPNDRAEMAALLGVPRADLDALQTVEGRTRTEIAYIERDFRAGVLRRDHITLHRRQGAT